MGNVIDLERVRRAHRHLERAKELDPTVTARPVPIEGIIMEKLALSIVELAAVVSLSPDTIRRAIKSGDLKAAYSGGSSHYRISKTDANAWWQSRGGGVLFPDTPGSDATGQ